MKISIKDITSLPDQSKKFSGSCDIQNFSYLGSDFSINHIEPFDVVLSMIGTGKLHITFTTKCTILGACDRCLSQVSFDIPVSTKTFSTQVSLDTEKVTNVKEHLITGDVYIVCLNGVKYYYIEDGISKLGIAPVYGTDGRVMLCRRS